MKTAETPAGTFTINRLEIPTNYTCAAEQKIEHIGEKILFKDHYGVKEWKKSDSLPEIHEWYPHIKKAGCFPCRNCGRC